MVNSPHQRCVASCGAVGNFASGGRRYSTLSTAHPDSLAIARHTPSCDARLPICHPPTVKVNDQGGKHASSSRAIEADRDVLFARRHYQLLDRSDLLDIHSGEHALEVVAGDLDGQQVTVWLVAGSCVVEQLTGNG